MPSNRKILSAILLLFAGAALADDAITNENWRSLDANGDGKVTSAENRAQADAVFKKVDRNSDGAVSREEFGAAGG